ncbi:MAG: sugar nucleotide-binding protein [Limnobacter sp.]|nr:sugar nucleotide-binding protein [Limnobacter sp.]
MGIRLLILGANGQLGHSLSQHAKPALGETLNELVCWGKDKVDFTKPDQIVSALKDVRPDVVINAAAYTQVEKAEDEPDIAHQINAKSVGVLAEQAKKQDVVLVHYSTDYVFDGTLGRPYVETDPLAPVNAYGQSKAEGENYLLQIGGNWVCFRTGWVYAQRGHNFAKPCLKPPVPATNCIL